MAWSLGHVTSMCKTGTQWVWSLGHVTSMCQMQTGTRSLCHVTTCNHGYRCLDHAY